LTEPPFAVLLAAACVAAAAVGFLKTSIGGGIGLVLAPTLTLVLPAPVVLALLAPLMNLADPVSLRYYWGRWDGRQLRVLIPATVAGIVVGAWLLALLSETGIKRAIGGVALAFALVQLAASGRDRPLLGASPHWSIGAVTGLVAGASSSVAHLGGSVLWLYLLATGATPAVMVGTSVALIAVSNLVKLLAYWRIGFLTWDILLVSLLASPLLVAGGWLGYRVNRRLPRRAFELVVVAIAIAGSLRLLLGS